MHTPDWHVSPREHAFPSLHTVPLLAVGLVHAPVVVLQVPGRWHWSVAAQSFGAPGWQTPAWHVSPSEQALPSLHTVPSERGGFEHVPLVGLQVPAEWH